MSQVEKELMKNDRAKEWSEFYMRLINEASLKTINDPKYSVSAARKPENRNKNRYRDVSPYDHSRIVIEKSDDDYINASLVEVPVANRRYILAQGPLEHTAGQFWQAVWEQNSKAIVMLNRVIEKGAIKCHQYWPLGSHNDYENEMLFEDVELKVTLLEEENFENFTKRLLSLEDLETGDKRDVTHFHYTTWPDFGVPSSPTAFLDFLMEVRETGYLDSDCGPAVIHCSAGIGRSGTFCLVDSCLVQIERERTLNCVDIRSMLIDMRSYRMGLIQTFDQLRFSYLAVIEGGKRILTDDNSNLKQLTKSQEKTQKEDEPPSPPPRTSSLEPIKQPEDEPPELPVKQNKKLKNEDQQAGGSPAKRQKIDVNNVMVDSASEQEKEKTVVQENGGTDVVDAKDVHLIEKDEGEDDSKELNQLRRRLREERRKQTADKIKNMKEKQRKSELWKERKSYIKPICLGITLLLGSYLLYRYYWR